MTGAAGGRDWHGAGGARLLLVDDDPLVLLILRAVLAAEGWQVVTALSLADARPLLAGAEAIVVDGLLPDGHGLDLLKEPEVVRTRPFVVLHTGTEPAQPVGVPVVLKQQQADELIDVLRAGAARRR